MFWKLHSLVAIVVLQVLAQTLTNGLPCKLADNCTWESVGCQVFGYELYCVNKNIAGVVERIDFLGISENITFLNFQYNHISGLGPNAFLNVPTGVYQVSFAKNSIQVIDPDAIANLQQLKNLLLTENNFTYIDAAFLNSSSLKVLYLDENSLARLHPNSFMLLPNLVLLDVSHNSLTSIDHLAFSGLEKLSQLYAYGNPSFDFVSEWAFVDCCLSLEVYRTGVTRESPNRPPDCLPGTVGISQSVGSVVAEVCSCVDLALACPPPLPSPSSSPRPSPTSSPREPRRLSGGMIALVTIGCLLFVISVGACTYFAVTSSPDYKITHHKAKSKRNVQEIEMPGMGVSPQEEYITGEGLWGSPHHQGDMRPEDFTTLHRDNVDIPLPDWRVDPPTSWSSSINKNAQGTAGADLAELARMVTQQTERQESKTTIHPNQ